MTTDEIMALADEYAATRTMNGSYVEETKITRAALRAAVEQIVRDNANLREEFARRDAIYKSGTVVVPNDEYSALCRRAERAERECDELRDALHALLNPQNFRADPTAESLRERDRAINQAYRAALK